MVDRLSTAGAIPADNRHGGWWRRRFPALGHQPFRWYLSGSLVSVIGTWMQQAALLWHVQMLTRADDPEYWLGVTAGTVGVPIVLFSPFGGALADKLNRRWLIVGAQTVFMVLALGFGLLVLADWTPIWVVLVFAGLNGLVMAYDIPARQAFAVEMVGREDLMSAIALNSASFNVGRLLGPMVAGWVIAGLGIGYCFLLNGGSFVGVILALTLMRLPRVSPDPAAREHERGTFAGFIALFSDWRLARLFLTLAIVLITGGTYLTLLPALADKVLGIDAGGYSILLTFNGLGSLLGALAVGSTRSLSSRQPTMLLGIVLLGGGLVTLSLARSEMVAAAILVVTGAGFVTFLASTNSMIQLSVSDAIRGRMMSIWVLVFGACQPIGNFAAGAIASRIGTRQTMLLEGMACLLAALAVTLHQARYPADPQADVSPG